MGSTSAIFWPKSRPLTECVVSWDDSHALRRVDAQKLEPPRGPVAPARTVDDLDRRIIEELQAHHRASFRRIAGRLRGPCADEAAGYPRLTSADGFRGVDVT